MGRNILGLPIETTWKHNFKLVVFSWIRQCLCVFICLTDARKSRRSRWISERYPISKDGWLIHGPMPFALNQVVLHRSHALISRTRATRDKVSGLLWKFRRTTACNSAIDVSRFPFATSGLRLSVDAATGGGVKGRTLSQRLHLDCYRLLAIHTQFLSRACGHDAKGKVPGSYRSYREDQHISRCQQYESRSAQTDVLC